MRDRIVAVSPSFWILLANSPRGPFGRNLGDLECTGKVNPGLQTLRAEFASSIFLEGEPDHPGVGGLGHGGSSARSHSGSSDLGGMTLRSPKSLTAPGATVTS
jgi:hypothetical protein